MYIYSKNRRQYTLLIIMVIGVLFAARSAQALTLSPVRLEVNGNPGDSLKEQMVLTNDSEGLINFYSRDND